MKKYLLTTFLAFSVIGVFAQRQTENVGIGTVNPNPSAILDLNSSNQGLLMPRLTEAQRESISEPAKGLLIFQMDKEAGFYFFNGEAWSPITKGEANALTTLDQNGWSLNGNVENDPGKKVKANANSFIGVPHNIPINFKIGEERAGEIKIGSLFIGYKAGNSTYTKNSQIGIGNNALNALTTGKQNLAVGINAMSKTEDGEQNVAVGYSALENNKSGSYNIAIGASALAANTKGSQNFGLGFRSLETNTEGKFNLAIGAHSMQYNETGGSNVGIGRDALRFLEDGSTNIAIGAQTLNQNVHGSGNIAIGYQAGFNEEGSNKLYIANSDTKTPLIYGNMAANYNFVSIGEIEDDKRDEIAKQGEFGLLVQKGILTEKLKVAKINTNDWADYVFEPEYIENMKTLEEIEAFVKENKHLPNVPSAKELSESGLDFVDTSRMFMEKIEELTLYMIEMNKEIKALKAENEMLKNK